MIRARLSLFRLETRENPSSLDIGDFVDPYAPPASDPVATAPAPATPATPATPAGVTTVTFAINDAAVISADLVSTVGTSVPDPTQLVTNLGDQLPPANGLFGDPLFFVP